MQAESGAFGRIVFEFQDSLPGAEIEYLEEAIACGSGQRVPSPSSAILQVRFQNAQAHDNKGKATAKVRVGLFGPALLQGMQIFDFEGELTWALAMNGKRPSMVSILKSPTRLVVDFPHSP